MFDGKPDLKGCLSPDAMYPQCRKQANNSVRYTQRHFRQGPVLADCLPWQAINSSGNSFELPSGDQSTEHYGWQLLLR